MAWMSETEAATALGVSSKTIRRRVGNGSLPSMRQGSDLLVNVEIPCIEEKPAPSRMAGPLAIESVGKAVQVVNTGSRPAGESRPPIVPREGFPKMLLTAATLGRGRAAPAMAAASPNPASGRPTVHGPGFAIWALVTLLLTGGAFGSWLLQQSKLKIQDVERRYSQAIASAEQARHAAAQELTVRTVAAAEREAQLTAELKTAQDRAGELGVQIEEQKRHAAELRGALDESTSRMASLGSQRQDLLRRLAAAEVSLTALRLRAGVADAIQTLALRVGAVVAHSGRPGPQFGEQSSTPAARGGPQTDTTRVRRLPLQAPSLVQEDLAMGLRPIVQE